MSAPDELRAAATSLRALAHAATTTDGEPTGPWSAGTTSPDSPWGGRHHVTAADTFVAVGLHRVHAEFIAAMDPPLAYLLARWLDLLARDMDEWDPDDLPLPGVAVSGLDLARAINGGGL